MTISFESRGDFSRTNNWLKRLLGGNYTSHLDSMGKEGVKALASMTPVDSGETATSWSYKVEKTRRGYTISWYNSHINNGVPIAIILQYGHGTGTGGYVQGRDYINPAIRPIFDEIADRAWKAVKSA